MLRKMKDNEFRAVYDILHNSFDKDEIRSYDGQKKLFEDTDYSIYVGQTEINGLLAVWNFGKARYIEHFAVDEKYRNNKLGSVMLEEYLNMSKSPVILEVELPGSEFTDRRIGFYKRHGFKFNDYDYVQPPMEEGKSPVPLRIMSWPNNISAEEYERYRKILYKKVYKSDWE